MRWFKHLSAASDDPFIVELEASFGLDGYARWWKLLEAVASQINPKDGRWTVSYPWAKWQQILQGKRKKLETFLEHLTNQRRISVVSSGNILEIGICNLQKYIDEYARKSGATPERLRTKDTDTEAEEDILSEADKGQPDGCPTDTPSPATKKRKTSADHRPNACPVEQWEKYLAYSRKFLAEQHEQLGDMVKPDEAKAISGAKVLDTLIRVRGHPAAKVYRALEWAKADPFWVLQVRSLGGLLAKGKNGEEKFDNLCAAMIREAMQDERKNRSAA